MASHTLSVRPGDDVTIIDVVGAGGPIVGLRIDGSMLFLGDLGDADASIVASADLLIGKLTELRDAAAGRIWDAEHAALDDASPAQGHEVVAEWTRPEAATA